MSPVLKALAVAIAAYTAFTGCIGTFFMFTHEVGRPGMLQTLDFRLSLRQNTHDTLLNGVAAALAVDETVDASRNAICADRYGALRGHSTMPDLLRNSEVIRRNRPPEVKQLAEGRYFIAALLHDNEAVFGFWQRELLKVVLMLGNRHYDNIFVSIYESGSSDMTKVCLVGLTRLLAALHIPHRVITDEPLSGMTRIEHLALLRNLALEPIFSIKEPYDQVLYLNDIYFCAADVLDLVRVVHEKAADMTCSVDYVGREVGTQGQDELRLYDMWVAHDIKGNNFVNDWPYMCDPDSQEKFAAFQPVRVFSCWNGMVAIKADVFQSLGVRFRAAHQFECKLSECDIVVRDMWAKGRDKIVMVPTARTAYDFKVFDSLSKRANPGLPAAYPLDLSPIPLPAQATCCPLNDLFHLVRFEECFSDENWALAYQSLGVPLASNASSIAVDQSIPPDVTSLTRSLQERQQPEVRRECEGLAAVSKIPLHMVHFAGEVGTTDHDRHNKMALSALSWAAKHPCFSYVMIEDPRLEAIAAHRFKAQVAQLGDVPNSGVRMDYLRLLYMYEHGGYFVPANSWAHDSLLTVVNPHDTFVLGKATNPESNATYYAFLAVTRRSPLVAEILTGALELLDDPLEVARLMRNDGSIGAPDARERYHMTGMGMILRTIAKHGKDGVRFVNFDVRGVKGHVGRPERLCKALIEQDKLEGVAKGPMAIRIEGTDGSGGIQRESAAGLLRTAKFDMLRVGKSLFRGQYIPSFFGGPPRDMPPCWTTPPITEVELAIAGMTEPPKAVFAYLNLAGEFGIYAGLGPLDKSARLLRTVAKARSGTELSACQTTVLVLQDDSNLVLYCEKVDDRGRASLVPLWAAGSSLPYEYRRARQSFLILRRDGRLALYPGFNPGTWGYDIPPGPPWEANVTIAAAPEVEDASVGGGAPLGLNVAQRLAQEQAQRLWDAAQAKAAAAGPETCEDFHDNCPRWVASGDCFTNERLMHRMCRGSCGMCGKPPPKSGVAAMLAGNGGGRGGGAGGNNGLPAEGGALAGRPGLAEAMTAANAAAMAAGRSAAAALAMMPPLGGTGGRSTPSSATEDDDDKSPQLARGEDVAAEAEWPYAQEGGPAPGKEGGDAEAEGEEKEGGGDEEKGPTTKRKLADVAGAAAAAGAAGATASAATDARAAVGAAADARAAATFARDAAASGRGVAAGDPVQRQWHGAAGS